MSIATATAETLPLVVPYQPMRMSVADYHKLIADGTLTENHRIELLRGVMTEKMTHDPLHAELVGILQSLLNAILPAGFYTRSQVPITLADSEPEPDVSGARGKRGDFATRHPGPTEVPFVAEIANTSIVTDRFKGEIYAEAGIPVYWIVNLVKRRVEVYSKPSVTADGPRYANCQEFQSGDSIPVIVDGREIGVLPAAEILLSISEGR
jgi:Uma2 family endonuclease